MLYDRDYRKLTEEEVSVWKKVEELFNKSKRGGIISPAALHKYWDDLPCAVVHYKQLFPNNYIIPSQLRQKNADTSAVEKFKCLLNGNCTERSVLNFIKEEKAYDIVTSIFDAYRLGHHSSFVFREFELPPNYIADFLLVGKNSGGYEFIFVELESPYGQIVTKDGDFGNVIRKGIKQVMDWDSWLEKNYYSLRLVFEKHLGKMESLPKEFFELEKSRIHYVVIAGRRSDYKEKTYELRRRLLKSNNILLLHYDNLFKVEALLESTLLGEY